jgi:hypothetical protein
MAMTVGGWVCDSCAASQITNLGQELGPEHALKTFCKKALLPQGGRWGSAHAGKFNMLEPHYIFIAGPEVSGHGHSKAWVRYGTEFATYLRKHRLGRVASTGKVINEKHHPDTDCQVWVWQPNALALQKWWTRMSKKWVTQPKKKLRPEDPNSVQVCPNCNHRVAAHTNWKCPYAQGTWPEYED